MDKNLIFDLAEKENTEKICFALSCKTRRDILNLIRNPQENYSIWQIAETLNVPVSTISAHIKILQNAGILTIRNKPHSRGGEKIVIREYDYIVIGCGDNGHSDTCDNSVITIPVGSYFDFKFEGHCGMVDEFANRIGAWDNPQSFLLPSRFKAQLLWFSKGYIEYKIPTAVLNNKEIKSITISLEICSEVPKYNNDWKSDISFFLNGKELLTYTSPGDFGGRKGIYTPQSWPTTCTQYGLLKTIKINDSGCYLDEIQVSSVKIEDCGNLNEGLSLRIEISENAKNSGGINIFGAKFGDYPQHIVINISYKKNQEV